MTKVVFIVLVLVLMLAMALPAFANPLGGFVTGGGWIDRPTGKASFSFVAKYKKGANTPTGNLAFHSAAEDISFRSDTYEWLVIAANQAQLKGEGTLNGEGGYTFLIIAKDGDPDELHIRITDGNNVVYESSLPTQTVPVLGGAVVIH